VSGNRIPADLQSFTNSGAQTFRNNRMDGNLQCNAPPRGV
jgi:hypothetical protein